MEHPKANSKGQAAVLDFLKSELGLNYFSATESLSRTAKIFETLERYFYGEISFSEARESYTKLNAPIDALNRVKALEMVDVSPIPIKRMRPSDFSKKTRPWTAKEDNRLLVGIMKNGLENWSLIAKFVGNNRTRAQCSQRWNRGLNPHISRGTWSNDEDALLMQYVAQLGNKSWSKIANLLGNRSDVQCRYHYKQLTKKIRMTDHQKTQIVDSNPNSQNAKNISKDNFDHQISDTDSSNDEKDEDTIISNISVEKDENNIIISVNDIADNSKHNSNVSYDNYISTNEDPNINLYYSDMSRNKKITDNFNNKSERNGSNNVFCVANNVNIPNNNNLILKSLIRSENSSDNISCNNISATDECNEGFKEIEKMPVENLNENKVAFQELNEFNLIDTKRFPHDDNICGFIGCKKGNGIMNLNNFLVPQNNINHQTQPLHKSIVAKKTSSFTVVSDDVDMVNLHKNEGLLLGTDIDHFLSQFKS